MRMREVRSKAKKMGINCSGRKNAGIIRVIRKAAGNSFSFQGRPAEWSWRDCRLNTLRADMQAGNFPRLRNDRNMYFKIRTPVKDRRRYPRAPVNNGTVAFYNKKVLGQIIDISLTGISFSYYYAEDSSSSGPFLPPEGTVDIVSMNKNFSLCDLPVAVAVNCLESDLQVPEYSVSKWRCGLEFGKVVNGQKFQLKNLVQYFTGADPVGPTSEQGEFPPGNYGYRRRIHGYVTDQLTGRCRRGKNC
ncbi:MAG: PilZ domain-containing protein [Proteobacteria bacterium]|nr:PilZ domain-containing protein [Pseudomonadota bacterium]MBU1739445.1 PilZ domain-containing protein [Pseudomonadota bacterium]